MAVGIVGVLLLSLALLVATFAIGAIPLYTLDRGGLSSGEQYVAVLSQFGVGMLMGTSFMLVIPEGMKACLQHDGNVGLNLLIGFIVVYLLDRWVQLLIKSSKRFAQAVDGTQLEIHSVTDWVKNLKGACMCILRNNVVFALFVHGISDGIALGTTTGNESLLIVVLIAIVIHKIPAVLSLTSLMISKQRLPRWEVLSNLFAFALSTPMGYLVVSVFNLKHSDTMDWIGGNLLLMSGGSLLYASFTAFVGDGGHDHSDLSQYEQVPDIENFEISEIGSSLPGTEANVASEDTNAVKDQPTAPISPDLASHTSSSKLRYDESVYVLVGVIIPIIISFLVKEE